MRLLIIVSLFMVSLQLTAQSVNTIMSARAKGLAYANATLADEYSLFGNVAGLAQVKTSSAVFAYDVQPSLPGANRMVASFVHGMSWGTGGLGFFRFGDELYSEQMISGGFSNQFGIASLGLKANYTQYRTELFGIQSAWSITLGGIADLTEQLKVGATVSNLNRPKISNTDNDYISPILNAGISFKLSDRVQTFGEIEKHLDSDPTIKGAVEYALHKKVLVRTGFNLRPNAGFFGIGYVTRRLKVDYAIQYVQSLYLSHQASASFQIKNRKKNEK